MTLSLLVLISSCIAFVLCLVALIVQLDAYFKFRKHMKNAAAIRLRMALHDVYVPDPKSLMDYGEYQSPCSLSEQSKEIRFMPPIIGKN